MEIYELGTDIQSDWTFHNGDVNLVSDIDNMVQSIKNKINTQLDSIDFYNVYGSNLRHLLGGKHNPIFLRFIKIEVDVCLNQDPRLRNATVDVEYTENGEVNVKIYKKYDDDTDLSLSLVLANNGDVIDGD